MGSRRWEARGLQLALQFGSERQQFERRHLAAFGPVLVEVGQCPPGLGAVELHPAPADVDEVGAVLGGAAEHFLRHRRVVDHDLPLHERGGAEPAPGGALLRLGRGAGGGASTGELLGSHQLDAGSGQVVDGLERGGSFLEPDPRPALRKPVSQFGHRRTDGLHRVDPALTQQWQEPLVAGDGASEGSGERDVVGRAPTAAVVGVDDLECERPFVAGRRPVGCAVVGHAVVGHAVSTRLEHDRLEHGVGAGRLGQTQPEAGAQDGLAVGAARHGGELVGDVGHGLHQVVGHLQLATAGGDERAAHEASGAGVYRSGLDQHRVPRPPDEREPGEAIDHAVQDLERIDGTAGGHHRGHGCQQRLGGRDIGGQWLPLGEPMGDGDVGDHRHHSPLRHEVVGIAEDLAEPGHRRTDAGVQHLELAQ